MPSRRAAAPEPHGIDALSLGPAPSAADGAGSTTALAPPAAILRFRTSYMTVWGQSLVVCGAPAAMGGWDATRGVPLTCHHEGDELIWEGAVALPASAVAAAPFFEYKYAAVSEAGGAAAWEADPPRRFVFPPRDDSSSPALVDVRDGRWQAAADPHSILLSAAFRGVILPHRPPPAAAACPPAKPPAAGEIGVTLRIANWRLGLGESVVLVLPAAGGDRAVPMTETTAGAWEAAVTAPVSDLSPLQYRYAISGGKNHGLRESSLRELWHVPPPFPTPLPAQDAPPPAPPTAPAPPASAIVCADGHFRYGAPWRGAGVATPVFSLRSRSSVGCGEFLDLVPFVDWAVSCGLRIAQILPVNDTSSTMTWHDSYPYSAVSAFALHPMYLCLSALGTPDSPLPPTVTAEIEAARAALDGAAVDYEATIAVKTRIARAMHAHDGPETLASPAFRAFFTAAEPWLRPYAAFCVLRDITGTADHAQCWGSALSRPSPALLGRLTAEGGAHFGAVSFWYYLQFHLHTQLLAAAAHARAVGVVLKGDLPIGVDKRSADTWTRPREFRMAASTGAPPDAFDPNGQNWGFPTYNWEEMARDGYGWWRARLAHMAQYFSAYRIDHILGFFRIWELPASSTTGLLGRFRPSLPLTREELESRGLWDIDRLTRPHITDSILPDLFGPHAAEIASRYLEPLPGGSPGTYRLKDEVATEAKIAAELKPRPGQPAWVASDATALQRCLMRAVQNVVLLRDPEDTGRFYPRIELESTLAFASLDDWSRGALRDLYQDYFFRRQADLWRAHAARSLPVLLGATRMLVCGEDLGMIPACVPPVLASLGLMGLRIQRMPHPGDPVGEFGTPESYPYLAVAAPSCHDTSTLRAWYEEDPGRRERFYRTVVLRPAAAGAAAAGIGPGSVGPGSLTPGLSPRGPGVTVAPGVSPVVALTPLTPVPDKCGPAIVKAVLESHLASPAVLAIFPLQDILALRGAYTARPAAEETINDPTNAKHYWRYRCHVRIEDLAADEGLATEVRGMLRAAGRE